MITYDSLYIGGTWTAPSAAAPALDLRSPHDHSVIGRAAQAAPEDVDRAMAEGHSLNGAPLACHASTRKGTPCQRDPLPGSKYCPSHKHLEEDFAATAA